jgi:hypothetical protein
VNVENIGRDLFDSLPKQCPGCGKFDSPAESGPSKLMLLWQPLLNSYICIDCNRAYTEWLSKDWQEDFRERNKPLAVQNVEAIAQGTPPKYDKWVYESPMNVNQHP